MTPTSDRAPEPRDTATQDPRGSRGVFLDRRSVNASRILRGVPSIRLVRLPVEADLVWVRRGFETLLPQLREDQMLNHFAQEGAMINKGRLAGHLARSRIAGDPVDFYPETYRLFDADERARFLEQLPETDAPENLWIFKPSGLSRGKGIRILWQLAHLKSGDDPLLDAEQQYIAQRYIRQPLLLKGRKSEVRVYWIVASVDPLLVLMYREGTVRLCNQAYQLGDFDNVLIHVANTFQQKKHPDFDGTKELKWRFGELDRDLADRFGSRAYTETTLKPAVRAALAQVARSVLEPLRDTGTRGMCFGLFGADFIIDETLRPWLTEIQKNPGLSHVGDPVKIHVVPPMLQEAVRIALEVRDRNLAGRSLADLETVDGFEWVANDATTS